MLRTEEEARKCWCPFARYGAGECAVNRDPQSDHFGSGNKCIASECMAWRWQLVETEASKQRHGIGTYPPPSPVYEQTERGYCGLAQLPQSCKTRSDCVIQTRATP